MRRDGVGDVGLHAGGLVLLLVCFCAFGFPWHLYRFALVHMYTFFLLSRVSVFAGWLHLVWFGLVAGIGGDGFGGWGFLVLALVLALALLLWSNWFSGVVY